MVARSAKVKGVRSTRPSWNKVFLLPAAATPKKLCPVSDADRATKLDKEPKPLYTQEEQIALQLYN